MNSYSELNNKLNEEKSIKLKEIKDKKLRKKAEKIMSSGNDPYYSPSDNIIWDLENDFSKDIIKKMLKKTDFIRVEK